MHKSSNRDNKKNFILAEEVVIRKYIWSKQHYNQFITHKL